MNRYKIICWSITPDQFSDRLSYTVVRHAWLSAADPNAALQHVAKFWNQGDLQCANITEIWDNNGHSVIPREQWDMAAWDDEPDFEEAQSQSMS